MTSAPSSAPLPRGRLGLGAAIVLVIAVLAVTVGIGILRGQTAPVDTIVVDGESGPSAPPAAVYVHVSGAVLSPGLYVLGEGARVVDVVAVAGGFAADADESAVNLAREVSDGEQLHVPLLGEASAPAAGAAGDGRINLNVADAAQLESLPRIGPALAARIIEWRESNGGFTSVEDLLAVPGIGDKMLSSLRDLVTV